MKPVWAFRFAGILKAVFLIFLLFLTRYRQKLLQEDSGHSFLSGLTIEFPWYFYLIVYTITACYFFSLLLTNIAAWWPCSVLGKFYQRKQTGTWIVAAEIMLLIAGCFVTVVQFSEAYRERNSGIEDRLFHFFLDTKNTSRYIWIDKMEAINFLISALASLIVVIVFSNAKRAMDKRCGEKTI